MRHLQQDADAVARLAFGIFARTVFQLFHDFQRIVHDLMRCASFDIDDRADPACVMFKRLCPQAMLLLHVYCTAFLLFRKKKGATIKSSAFDDERLCSFGFPIITCRTIAVNRKFLSVFFCIFLKKEP